MNTCNPCVCCLVHDQGIHLVSKGLKALAFINQSFTHQRVNPCPFLIFYGRFSLWLYVRIICVHLLNNSTFMPHLTEFDILILSPEDWGHVFGFSASVVKGVSYVRVHAFLFSFYSLSSPVT